MQEKSTLNKGVNREFSAWDSEKDHTQMLTNYVQAVYDWLDLFGSHTSLWGVDIMNEPEYGVGVGVARTDVNGNPVEWAWHGMGTDTTDGNGPDPDNFYANKGHRIRDFLTDAYDEVKSWCQQNGRDIKVVCDISGSFYNNPRNYVDMAHPWDTGNPIEIRKVCDVWGLHWYQECGDDGVGVKRTQLWSSDRLQPWRHPDEGYAGWMLDPVTDWMAEKPIILTETHRYERNDWGRSPWDGDAFFEIPADNLSCINGSNCWWYHNHLDRGKSRHIESYIFWDGSGSEGDKHLVRGTPVNGIVDNLRWGWKSSFSVGFGDSAIRNYDSD